MVFKCKMCGGDIVATEGAAFGTCDSCGITSTLPKAADEKLVNLFNRANHFRRLNEFDRALGAYESILTEDNTNAEAHWCVALCRYGIEYVEDPKTGERVPTCHRANYDPIVKDADYLAALEHAEDGYARELYETEAKKINEIQKNILAISSREEPFDVFICYKETTDGGSRTKDSVIAQDIHDALTKEGLRVFFARITLENMLGAQYEPYIFGALNTAKVMLVIGTQKEHFNAVWVRNEWSRFLALMKKDRAKTIVPCYRDMDAYDLPEELSMYQSQDMGKIGFAQDLIRGVKKITYAGKKKEAPATATTSQGAIASVDSLLKRGQLLLEDGDFNEANRYFDRVLDADPENVMGYIGKLCAEVKAKRKKDLGNATSPIGNSVNYRNALRFADATLQADLQGYEKTSFERLEKEKKERAEEEAQQRHSQHIAENLATVEKYERAYNKRIKWIIIWSILLSFDLIAIAMWIAYGADVGAYILFLAVCIIPLSLLIRKSIKTTKLIKTIYSGTKTENMATIEKYERANNKRMKWIVLCSILLFFLLFGFVIANDYGTMGIEVEVVLSFLAVCTISLFVLILNIVKTNKQIKNIYFGTNISAQTCKNCGNHLSAYARFCGECGTTIS